MAALQFGQLTLDQALTIAQGVLEKARELGLKPMSAAVLDTGGHLRALLREDGSSNLRPKLAIGKASGALALGVSSRQIGKMAEERPHFVNALATVSGSMIPAAGGLLITTPDGLVLGTVGVMGDTSDKDEECALYGLQTAGFGAA